jgi:energy-coupling factor transporter ATP-binding protein EcfA2
MDEPAGAVVGDKDGWVAGMPSAGRRGGRRTDPWPVEPWDVLAEDQDALTYAVRRLREEVGALALPFEIPGASVARREREFVLDRLDGYVLPRVAQPDAPLLVVIGGSTGAGKSTLTNSLIGVDVSPAGFLRPTTRHPVLIHHPLDTAAFVSHRILPDLARMTVAGYGLDGGGPPAPGAPALALVPHEAVPPGLALIDSPDLDSVATRNRAMAHQLFRAADLWIFVTTGTDYADAVPWDLLTEAVQRRVAVAVVLDRMRLTELEPVRMHFASMLIEKGLSTAPVFTIPDTVLVDGLLPTKLIGPLQGWLDRQASEAVRGAHVERAVDGTLGQILGRISLLAGAADDQAVADKRLRIDLEALFGRARDLSVARATDGSVADERVVAAWHRIAEVADPSAPGRFRRRMTAVLRGNGGRYAEASAMLRQALLAMTAEHVDEAMELVGAHWRNHPVASERLPGRPHPFGVGPDFHARAEGALNAWLAGAGEIARPGQGRHLSAPGEDPLVLALTTLATCPVGDPATSARGLIESEGGLALPLEEAVRLVREDLGRRLSDVVLEEGRRLSLTLGGSGGGGVAGLRPEQGEALRTAADAVRELLPDV